MDNLEQISDFITAITSIVAIIVALIALRIEGKRNRFALGIQVLMEYSKQFNSTEFKAERRKVAQLMTELLYKSQETNDQIIFENLNYVGAGEILDFFQELGAMTKNKVLNLETVWGDYSYWLNHYWLFFKDAVALEREQGFKEYAVDMEWLYIKFNEKKYQHRNGPIDFDGFITYELSCTQP